MATLSILQKHLESDVRHIIASFMDVVIDKVNEENATKIARRTGEVNEPNPVQAPIPTSAGEVNGPNPDQAHVPTNPFCVFL